MSDAHFLPSEKKKPPGMGRLWLVYFVGVFLLAWWPWNVWLIVGPACARTLKRF
jgi:hypothetical protein